MTVEAAVKVTVSFRVDSGRCLELCSVIGAKSLSRFLKASTDLCNVLKVNQAFGEQSHLPLSSMVLKLAKSK